MWDRCCKVLPSWPGTGLCSRNQGCQGCFYCKCRILSSPFSASSETITCFLLHSGNVWYVTLSDLCMRNRPCSPGINPTWPWVRILFMCPRIWLASTVVRHQWPSGRWACGFLVASLAWYPGSAGPTGVREYSLHFGFWEKFEKDCSLKVWPHLWAGPSGPGLSFVRRKVGHR